MGRYSQRQRRGGGASASAPPPSPVTIVDVNSNLGVVIVTFSGNVTLVADFTTPALSMGGFDVTGGFQVNPAAVQVSTAGLVSSGDTWTLVAQPSWILEPVTNPDGGSVS